MGQKNRVPPETGTLRERAEAVLRSGGSDVEPVDPEVVRTLVHELSMHQVELELQNEELRRVQVALADARDAYLDLYEFAPVGYLRLDAHGAIREANCASSEMFGIERSRLLGRWLSALVVPEDRPVYYEYRRGLPSSTSPQTAELRIQRRGGDVVFVELRSTMERTADQTDGGSRVTLIDITARKRAEQELARYRDHLQELVDARSAELDAAHRQMLKMERLATLGQLTASVSHELRNPLGTVRSSIFSIGQTVRTLDLGIDDVLERAERNIMRCDAIIEELLDYARPHPISPIPTRVDEWLDHVVAEQAVPPGISVIRRFSSGVELPIDREKLRRCVVNLITNACQAMQEDDARGGTLTCESRVTGPRLEIRIQDTGPGIPADQLEKIWEPLFSTRGFGVGLGLPIVQRLAEAHGGGVELTSGPDRGTVATLWLPLAG